MENLNKEKQIEKDELFGILSNTINGANFDDLSEAVYKISDVAGYRKQEWISVEDRLPETDTRVLVYMHENRMSYTKIDTDRIVARKWVRWGNLVTHWMPLPEAPKMKGDSDDT